MNYGDVTVKEMMPTARRKTRPAKMLLCVALACSGSSAMAAPGLDFVPVPVAVSVLADQPAPAASITLNERVEFVTKLALIQGHLWVAAQLVEADQMPLAAKHAKHPAQEVYQELLPFFAAIDSSGFAQELEHMSGKFGTSSDGAFEPAYRQVMAAIDTIVASQQLNCVANFRVAKNLVAQAFVEYQAGLQSGVIVDLQEYQDARGFVQIAEKLIQRCEASKAREVLLAQVAAAKQLWPSLNPQEPVRADTDQLLAVSKLLEAALR
ncbi:MAG: hypothetical protein GWP70_04795 [Proteobacteria bacterium]|nr:hypothetical protein [Pseudomonadota bacterium]